MNRDMVILKENENYIAFFPGIYHFFPCTKLQSDFLQNGHKQITENRQYQGDKTLSIREFYQKVDIFIKTKADELDNERRIRKNSQAQKDLEIFGKESVRILGRLIMNPSSTCNLMCRYCYAQNYLNGETCRHMSIETARAALENFYRQYDAVRVIHFLGGEPLLNIDVIKYVCSWITKRFKRGIIKMLPVFAIITNGTIVSEEIIKTIKKFKIQVVVSIDGPSDINDKNRVFKMGKELTI